MESLKRRKLGSGESRSCPFCADYPFSIEHIMADKVKMISVDCQSEKCSIKPKTQRFKTLSEALTVWNKQRN